MPQTIILDVDFHIVAIFIECTFVRIFKRRESMKRETRESAFEIPFLGKIFSDFQFPGNRKLMF